MSTDITIKLSRKDVVMLMQALIDHDSACNEVIRRARKNGDDNTVAVTHALKTHSDDLWTRLNREMCLMATAQVPTRLTTTNRSLPEPQGQGLRSGLL